MIPSNEAVKSVMADDYNSSVAGVIIALQKAYDVDVSPIEARIAELEAALKPFAYDYGDYSDGMWSDLDYIQVSVGDLRAAREALEKTNK